MAAAVAVLPKSRATLYRSAAYSGPRCEGPAPKRKTNSPRKLSAQEIQELTAEMHSERFVDQPPREIYAALLRVGKYRASISTMYRLLKMLGASAERRAQRNPMRYSAPAVIARRPNEVWVWDITRLPGPRAGVWYYVYVIMDLYSRYVVGWLIAPNESTLLAEQLFNESLKRHEIKPGQLTVHSDRGSPMTADLLQDAFEDAEIAPSFSRPQVSNDNPHAEAGFRTLKAQPDYPRRFEDIAHAGMWLTAYFSWYCDDHAHVGLALLRPADVFFGRVDEMIARQQEVLDQARALHPERFVNGPPIAKRPPTYVAIDPAGVFAHGPDGTDSSPLNPLGAAVAAHAKRPRARQLMLSF